MSPIIAFLDSDVVISSLLSKSGAAFALVHHEMVEPVISDASYQEMTIVAERLGIPRKNLASLASKRFHLVKIDMLPKHAENQYRQYVIDPNDAHIVAGAVAAHATFLISYNLKHFRADRVKFDFDLLLLTPARFLQYIRSF